MFQGIVIGAVGGLIAGTIYGKYVLADYSSIKAHITAEVASVKTTIATELASLRSKL